VSTCITISWYCHLMGQRDEILGNIYNALSHVYLSVHWTMQESHFIVLRIAFIITGIKRLVKIS